MSETAQELKQIKQLDDVPKKYVAVVYHHVSYQNEEGVVSPGDGNVISVGDNDGSCKLVSTHQKKHVNVPDYFPLSVLSLVIFIPMGLAAIANSLKVRKAIKLDDKPNAIDASNWALQHALTAIFVGPLLGCFLCLIIFLTMYQAHL